MDRLGAAVRVVSLESSGHGLKALRICRERLASVYPFPTHHSCGSLRHWVCPAQNTTVAMSLISGVRGRNKRNVTIVV